MDMTDDQWSAIIHGGTTPEQTTRNQVAAIVQGVASDVAGVATKNLASPLEPLPRENSVAGVADVGKKYPYSGDGSEIQSNGGLVHFASGLAQPDRTKPLAEFWGVSESAIKRWCKGVAELHGVNPTTPYTDRDLSLLAEFGIRCSDRWTEFKSQTGLSRRLSPAEFVQAQLGATGKGSQQRLEQSAQGVTSVNAADVQDAIADRRQVVRNQVADQVMAVAGEDYHSGKALAQQASQLLNGQAFLAGFMAELATELDNPPMTISLLPSGSTNYLPDR